ncbi:MAG TPA: TrbG/VirB9 family P-type conjugative transfer protein [Arsenophonus nasoniae]|uniref:TrbG/VirB9 family P-type conjugative transfer protein n=1 Tax=Arsenophonus nasoniae TaxID=638 RepID=UPI00387A3223
MNKSVFMMLLLFSYEALAVVIPKSSGLDPRVQEVFYQPDNVTVVKVKEGIATLIQLENDEVVDGDAAGMGLGDPLAWNVSVRGNNIFLRPIAEQPETNIALVTNKRTYSILLRSAGQSAPTFLMRFRYPPKPVVPNVLTGKTRQERSCTDGGWVNLAYQVKGSENLTPDAVWDDGIFTCIKWNNARDLPVVYRLLPDGKEQLVNYHMNKNIMVLHDVAAQFVMRLGQSVMNLRTEHTLKRRYNQKGTTTKQRLQERNNEYI